ncbi:4-dimethylallyltryptophan methyltransferase [Aspergillus homomorphus CBS 101889]|uniref:4-dimethylallyltryptophan N-methyltransferase n=1 Tax=Aspergillus homomorphus (strain CBS 101889) TaxID=1450537 RepID=A0A395HG92_ASPHC|nr:4-dimethylallyltryptophan methyltransferase [Aspergillus homomorphus CBS 101889]RAL06529.1 4-dimethylallyltryptophan methyltransferase [Aspergillus homomorphus CBS 101889]
MEDVNALVRDIRSSKCESSIARDIIEGMRQEPRNLPTILLYSEKGLQAYDRHSHAPGYYPRQEELLILQKQARNIANSIENGSVLLDLGSASLDKTLLLLEALEAAGKDVQYFALDLDHNELVSTLKTLPLDQFKHVSCAALHGTFDDGLQWLHSAPEIAELPKCVMFLGSTIGNFSRAEAAAFLKQVAMKALTRAPGTSSIILTVDGCKVPTKILHAYTGDGVLPFTLSAMEYASAIMSKHTQSAENAFNVDDWTTMSEWNSTHGRYEASFTPMSSDVQLGPPFEDVVIKKGDKIRIVYSHKYDETERQELFDNAGLYQVQHWTEDNCDLGFYQVKLPPN